MNFDNPVNNISPLTIRNTRVIPSLTIITDLFGRSILMVEELLNDELLVLLGMVAGIGICISVNPFLMLGMPII